MPLLNLKETAQKKLFGLLRGNEESTSTGAAAYYKPTASQIRGVQLVDPLAAHGQATAKVMALLSSGAALTSEEIEVYDYKGMTGEVGKRGEVFWQGGRWWVIFIMAECQA